MMGFDPRNSIMEKVVLENNALAGSVESLATGSKKLSKLIKRSESHPLLVFSLFYNQALAELLSVSSTDALRTLHSGIIYITSRSTEEAISSTPPSKKLKLSNSDSNPHFIKLLSLITATSYGRKHSQDNNTISSYIYMNK
jgi:hypothetical protein